jgi:lysophospholipase L1-like esterase
LPNLALAAFSCGGFLLFAEGLLRLWNPSLQVAGLDVRHGGNPLAAQFRSEHFVRDPDLWWAPHRSYPPFNAEGYRGQPVSRPKPPGELRILAVGDSNTLGNSASWANDLAVTFDPRLLGRQGTTVVNASVYGYSSYQGRIRLEQFRDFQPDLVLISFGGNDAGPNVAPDSALHASGWQRILDRWSSRLRLAALVRFAGHRLAHRSSGPPAGVAAPMVPRVSVDEYRDNLRAMIHRSRQWGARPVLFTRPFAYDEYAEKLDRPLRPYYFATLEVGAAEGVPVIDLHRIMGCHWSLYQDFAHFNARGHALAGGLVAQALASVLERGTYDPETVRYRPQDGPYEVLLDDLWMKVTQWMDKAQARAALAAEVRGRSRQTLFELASPSVAPGWRIEDPTGTLRIEPGRLCVAASLASPGPVFHVPPDPESYLFFWAELDGLAEAAVQLYWDIGGGFSEDRTVSDVFAGSFAQRPYRLRHLLPVGVTRVRMDIRPTAGPRVACLRQLWLERVGVAAPARPAAAAGQ